MAFYNENDAYPAAWLRNLIDAGHISPGTVDERSIADLQPEDIPDGQAHFFAGLGGWSYALRLAGVADDAPVWTGSCPCQPFSVAGKRRGHADERHLWPEWFRLIRECRPPVVFGEQVASKDGLGWLDAVFADLEGEGYACGAADMCAASVGAPHIRQRLWFVAHTLGERGRGREPRSTDASDARIASEAGRMEHSESERWERGQNEQDSWRRERASGHRREVCEMADGNAPGLHRQRCSVSENGDAQPRNDANGCSALEFVGSRAWGDVVWWPCRDGKIRPVPARDHQLPWARGADARRTRQSGHPEPSLFPLAHGISARVGRLRAYGNAIVPQVAAEFVKAFMGWQRAEVE